MEYFLEGRKISVFIVILYINVLAGESMWIWTQGCVKHVVHSRNVLNISDNLPHTCFQACGQQSQFVALQENLCSCDPHVMTTCGNSNGEFWSSYKKAMLQELAEQAIPPNATGCVIYSHGRYHVDDCSKTGVKSLCINAFSRKLNCDSKAGKWSPSACINTFDKLLNHFVGSVQCCRDECWIGLFSLEEQSLIEAPSSTTIDRTISQINVYVSPSETSTIYSKMIDSSEMLMPYSTPSGYSKMSLITTSSFQTESSVSPSAFVTEQISPVFTGRYIETIPPSLYGTYLHQEQQSTIVFTEKIETRSSKTLNISPTKESHPGASAKTSSYLHSSFVDISHEHTEQSAVYVTKTLSHLPVVSQSVLKNSSVIYSASNIIHTQSFIPNNLMTSYISPTNTMSEFTSTQYSFASTSMSTVLQPRTYTSITVAAESSYDLSMISSQRTVMDGMSRTKEPVSPTVILVSHQISPKTSFIIQKSNSETDMVIALTVVGIIAASALAAIGIMAVYMKRSLTNLKKAVSRTTTFTDDHPDSLRGEVSLQDMEDRMQRNNIYSDLPDASCCPSGTGSNLRHHGGNRPSMFFNGRPAIQDEDVLY